MDTPDKGEINRGIRSVVNLFAISLLCAYVSAYLFVLFLPVYIVFFIPIILTYFIAPKLHKPSLQSENSSYKNGRLIGVGLAFGVGVIGLVHSFLPILTMVSSGSVGNGSNIVNNSMGVLANVMYLVAFLVGYLRSK